LLKEAKSNALRQKAASLGITPLEVMLETMRTCWRNKDLAGAHAAAKDAAPYVHPRLNSIDAIVDQRTTHVVEEADEAADFLIAELARRRRARRNGADQDHPGDSEEISTTTH